MSHKLFREEKKDAAMGRKKKYYIESGVREKKLFSTYHLDMVFFFTFFLGIIGANLMGERSKNHFFMLNEYYLQQLKYTKIDLNGLLLHILENRLPYLILLMLLSFTLAGILTQIFFVGYFGLSLGFVCVMAITNFGWKGAVYIGGFLFPHYIFYVIFYVLFLKIFIKKKEEITIGKKELLIQSGILVLLLVLGLFTESYVNPVFLKNLIRIF